MLESRICIIRMIRAHEFCVNTSKNWELILGDNSMITVLSICKVPLSNKYYNHEFDVLICRSVSFILATASMAFFLLAIFYYLIDVQIWWTGVPFYFVGESFKDEVEFWSCDCIVKETVWNRSEKVDHLAYKNLCVLQGSGIIKILYFKWRIS